MKKLQINFSWPASLSNFSKDSVQGNFSRGKLKVFYKGETADHRFFSDEFADELIKTLPYTPVVSYYDEETEDFVGHATEQQIFGIVDPCTEPVFEKDDEGKDWCVCDVVLYTERPDKVGDLAAKIEGHPQSLELDPNSVKYVVNYDDKKHFKNIEFTSGKFVGVSVLGKDQKPAFSGSAFFTCDDNKLQEKMEILKNYCEGKNGQTQHGGEKMNLQEFMQLSWGEVSCKVGEKIETEYARDAYTYVVDMYEDAAIVRFWYYVEGNSKLMKINYSIDEHNNVVLGDIVEVHMTYEPIETPKQEVNDMEQVATTTDAVDQASCGNPDKKEDCGCGDKKECECNPKKDCECNPEKKEDCECNPKKECECDPKKPECECNPKEKENCECPIEDKKDDVEDKNDDKDDDRDDDIDDKDDKDDIDDDMKKKCGCENNDFSTETAQVSNVVENQETTEKASVENEQFENKQEDTSAATFAESERAELEALRREKKVALVNSFKDSLTEEDFAKFTAMVDSVDENTLELELLRAYKASENSRENTKPMRVFAACTPTNNNADNNSFDSWVEKHLKRK